MDQGHRSKFKVTVGEYVFLAKVKLRKPGSLCRSAGW